VDTLTSILHHIQHGQSTPQRAATSLSSIRRPWVWPAGCCIESIAGASHHSVETVLSLQSAGVSLSSLLSYCPNSVFHVSSPGMPSSPPGNARCRESGSVGAVHPIAQGRIGHACTYAMLSIKHSIPISPLGPAFLNSNALMPGYTSSSQGSTTWQDSPS